MKNTGEALSLTVENLLLPELDGYACSGGYMGTWYRRLLPCNAATYGLEI